MVLVKCKACGKRYDYKEHGCCPECGAYNRPPPRERVNADGTVHHMSDADFLENTEARRRSQGGKVCFERQECHEGPARRVRSSMKGWEQKINQQSARMQTGGGNRSGKIKTPRQLIAFVVVLVGVSIFPSLLTMCSRVSYYDKAIGVQSGSIYEEKEEAVKPDSYGTASYETTIGTPFIWWDAEAAVTDVAVSEIEGGQEVVVTVAGDDVWDAPMLYYELPDGAIVCAASEDTTDHGDGMTYDFCFFAPDMSEDGTCYAYFSGYNDDVYCEITVPLI